MYLITWVVYILFTTNPYYLSRPYTTSILMFLKITDIGISSDSIGDIIASNYSCDNMVSKTI